MTNINISKVCYLDSSFTFDSEQHHYAFEHGSFEHSTHDPIHTTYKRAF